MSVDRIRCLVHVFLNVHPERHCEEALGSRLLPWRTRQCVGVWCSVMSVGRESKNRVESKPFELLFWPSRSINQTSIADTPLIVPDEL